MEYYYNLAGGSGIYAYEIGADNIKVQFSSGSVYLYTYSSAGRENVEHMKRLAEDGKGLNRFISRNVKHRFQRKIK